MGDGLICAICVVYNCCCCDHDVSLVPSEYVTILCRSNGPLNMGRKLGEGASNKMIQHAWDVIQLGTQDNSLAYTIRNPNPSFFDVLVRSSWSTQYYYFVADF